MIKQTPVQAAKWLDALIHSPDPISAMIWGPPGIGKSQLVTQAAARAGLPVVELELAVLPPQELMGLPFVKDETSQYARPTFWPTTPEGILVLDDLSHAFPQIMAMSMSLLLSQRIGPHRLPAGWVVIATGNRTEDGAGAFKMPTATANRMVHIELEVNVTAWREWALGQGVSPDIIGLISLRPELLHSLSRDNPAWPSPRTWEMASRLHALGVDVASAVGEGAAAELAAFVDLKSSLPSLQPILDGHGDGVSFPDELSLKWALVVGLAFAANRVDEVRHAFRYLKTFAGKEWQSVFLSDVTARYKASGRVAELAVLMTTEPAFAEFVDGILELVA